jgi:hypothetical protein
LFKRLLLSPGLETVRRTLGVEGAASALGLRVACRPSDFDVWLQGWP